MSETLTPKYYRFLQQQLAIWRQEALISADQESTILQRYQASATALWQLLLYALAAILLGGGIILLLAHNWAQLSRPVRAVISYLPLLLSYVGLFVCYDKSRLSAHLQAAREGMGIFHALALMAALGLIGQTYHSGGDVYTLLRNSALLLLPVALFYPAQSLACMFIVFAAVCLVDSSIGVSWSDLGITIDWQNIAFFCLPFIFSYRLKTALALRWFLALYVLFFMLRLLVEIDVDLIWQSAYIIFPAYYVIGRSSKIPNAHNPLAVLGVIGIVATMLIMSWIGTANLVDNIAIAYLPVLVGGLIQLVVFYVVGKRLRLHQMAFALALPLVLLMVSELIQNDAESAYLDKAFLCYSFFIGIALCLIAEREQRWLKFNIGLLIVCNALAAAFFDSEASFMLRGIIFIVIGLLILGANIWLIKKRRAQ